MGSDSPPCGAHLYKGLRNDKPKGVNKQVERRNVVEVVHLDFQNAYEKVPLWKP